MNKRQKTLYARKVLLMQDKIALRFARKLIAEFRRFWGMVSDGVQGGLFDVSHDAELSHAARIVDLLTDLAEDTGQAFSVLTIDAIDPITDVYAERVMADLRQAAQTSAAGVANVTIDKARQVIADGIAQAKPQAEIVKDLQLQVGVSKRRAVVITRTETHRAANTTTYARADKAAEDSGLDVVMEWISTNDGRVRDSHKHANGQRVPRGELFRVGSESMRYPSDPRASAKNTINCRCVLGVDVE